MKKIVIFILVYLVSPVIYAQVGSTIFENRDAFEHYTELTIFENRGVSKQMPPIDVNKLIAEDKQRYEMLDVPFRFGYGFDVNYALNDGILEYRDSLWIMRIML